MPPVFRPTCGGPRQTYLLHPSITLFFGSLLRRVFFIRCGFVPLSLLPLSMVRPPERAHGVADMTQSVLFYIHAVDRLLGRMEQQMADDKRQIGRLLCAIENAPVLNHRQQSVLRDALLVQGVQFDFDSLIDRFQVAYNTVRSDMAYLVNSGYLYSTNDGRKLTFHPVPGIRSHVEERLGDASELTMR